MSVRPIDGNAVGSYEPTEVQRQFDEQRDQLTRQRVQLEQTVKQLEAKLQQVQAGQDDERLRLQREFDDCRKRMQTVDEQLSELQRQRVRADYFAALRAREQARVEQERASETAKQIEGLSVQLKSLQEQSDRTQRELEQIQDKDGPRAHELEKALEAVRQETLSTQERLRTMERERAAERLEAADRQRRAFESYVQDLGRRQEQSRQTIDAIRQELQELRQEREKDAGQWPTIQKGLLAMQDQIRQLQQQARAATEESTKRAAQQQSVEQWRGELTRQQEELRNQIRSMDEQLRAAAKEAGTGAQAFRKEMDRLRTSVQRMGQTLGRIERERADAQTGLKNEVQELRGQLSRLREDLALVQGSLNMLLSQMGRSTVGSAGYIWAW